MSILSEPVSFTVYRSQNEFLLGDGVTVFTRRRAEMVKESLARKGYSPVVEIEFPGHFTIIN